MNPHLEASMWDAIVFALKATVVVCGGVTAGVAALLIGGAIAEWRVRRRTMDLLIQSLEKRGRELLNRERAIAEWKARDREGQK